MLKKCLGMSAAVFISLSAAQAADTETAMEHDWSGPYIGVQAGYGWGESRADSEISLAQSVPAAAASEPITIIPGRGGTISLEGVLGGIHAGYNHQLDSFVFGIEGDTEFSDIKGDTEVLDFFEGETFAKLRKDYDWLASLRLRAGFAVDRALFYATGGVAMAQVDMSFKSLDGEIDQSDRETAFGVTLGAGVEFALAEHLTLRAEYRYTELEETSFAGDFENTFEHDFPAVRGGVSWYF